MKEKKPYFYIFMFFFSLALIFANGHWGGDGLENYLTAESIVLEGNLTIYDRPFQVKEMAYSPRGAEDSAGRHYASEGFGMALLLVPFYALGHLLAKGFSAGLHDYITQFCVSFWNPLMIAMTAMLLYLFLKQLAFKLATAFITALIYMLCTMSMAYARSGFSEPTLGLLVLGVLFLIYRYEKEGQLRYLFWASILVGYALLIIKNTVPYLILWSIYGLYRVRSFRKPRTIIAFLSAVFLPLIFFLGINTILPHKTVNELITYAIAERLHLFKGLFYYLFSPGKGYFFYNFILILALFGIRGFFTKHKKMAIYLLIFIIINFLFYSYRFQRGSLFSWGPRYLYTTIPLMCIFLAQFIEQGRSWIKKVLFVTFGIISFLIQLPVLFVSITKYLLFVKERLNLPEYFINFMPDLSPIGGAWCLFISALHRFLKGESLLFQYSPDPQFIKPVIVATLSGYDSWDIWWVNIGCVSKELSFAALVILIILIAFAVTSLFQVKRILSRE